MAKNKLPKILLVEGNDDQHVVWALCVKHEIPETFEVINTDGITNLLSQIPIRLKQSELQVLGFIIDADSDLAGRWSSIKQILKSNGFICPDQIPENGMIADNGKMKVGVWIMPNNSLNGMLEDFIHFLIPENDQLLVFATKTLNEIEEVGLNKYQLAHKSKALIHTWLSWQDDPGTPLGLAITKRYLSVNVAQCQSLIEWIKNVYG